MVKISKISSSLPYRIILFFILILSLIKSALLVSTNPKLLFLSPLPSSSSFFLILDKGFYISKKETLDIIPIYQFKEKNKTPKEKSKILFKEFKHEEKEYFMCAIDDTVYIYNKAEKHIYENELNLGTEINLINLVIKKSKVILYFSKHDKDSFNTKLISYTYSFDESLTKILKPKENKLYAFNNKETLTQKNLDCFIIEDNSDILRCSYYKNNQGLIQLEINVINNTKKEKILTPSELGLNSNININEIKSVFSSKKNNNNQFSCLKTDNNLSKCFISNNKELNVIPCINENTCRKIKVKYFEKNNEFIFACQSNKDIILTVAKNINNFKNIFCNRRKFSFSRNIEENFDVIYNEYINDYTIISSSNFTSIKKLRHLEQSDDSDINTDSTSTDNSNGLAIDELGNTNQYESTNIKSGSSLNENGKIIVNTNELNSDSDSDSDMNKESTSSSASATNSKIDNDYSSSDVNDDNKLEASSEIFSSSSSSNINENNEKNSNIKTTQDTSDSAQSSNIQNTGDVNNDSTNDKNDLNNIPSTQNKLDEDNENSGSSGPDSSFMNKEKGSSDFTPNSSENKDNNNELNQEGSSINSNEGQSYTDTDDNTNSDISSP